MRFAWSEVRNEMFYDFPTRPIRRISGYLALLLSIAAFYYSAHKGIHVVLAPLENPTNQWMRYGDYCVRPYYFAGDRVSIRLVRSWKDEHDFVIYTLPVDDPAMFEVDLTLLTHTSASAFDADYLIKLASNWAGPISYAVYVEENDEIAKVASTIKEASLDGFGNLSHVSIHLVIDSVSGSSCGLSFASLPVNTSQEAFHASYPINTIRNIARLFSNSRYIAFADSDYLFSANFYPRMMKSLSRVEYNETEKIVYFYRIFEIEEDVVQAMNYSITKPDLKNIIETDQGREFHMLYWYESHSVPLLGEWLKAPENVDNNLFYDLPVLLRTHQYWEFQFIGTRDVPYFDENFPYRHNNNLELRWELCRANYSLTAVHDLFVYHTLEKNPVRDDPEKKNEMRAANLEKYKSALRLFKNRMRILYHPVMVRKCPVYELFQ